MFVNARTKEPIKDCPTEAAIEQALAMLRGLAITEKRSSSVQKGDNSLISNLVEKPSGVGQAGQARKRQKIEEESGSSVSSSVCNQPDHSTNSVPQPCPDAKIQKLQKMSAKSIASPASNATTSTAPEIGNIVQVDSKESSSKAPCTISERASTCVALNLQKSLVDETQEQSDAKSVDKAATSESNSQIELHQPSAECKETCHKKSRLSPQQTMNKMPEANPQVQEETRNSKNTNSSIAAASLITTTEELVPADKQIGRKTLVPKANERCNLPERSARAHKRKAMEVSKETVRQCTVIEYRFASRRMSLRSRLLLSHIAMKDSNITVNVEEIHASGKIQSSTVIAPREEDSESASLLFSKNAVSRLVVSFSNATQDTLYHEAAIESYLITRFQLSGINRSRITESLSFCSHMNFLDQLLIMCTWKPHIAKQSAFDNTFTKRTHLNLAKSLQTNDRSMSTACEISLLAHLLRCTYYFPSVLKSSHGYVFPLEGINKIWQRLNTKYVSIVNQCPLVDM